MSESDYKLYAGNEQLFFSSFEEAQEAAKGYMASKAGLRIEILIDIPVGAADFWAYEYEAGQWVPS